MDLERIPGYMADYLSANGVAAEPAWSGGERFDKDSGQWRELYGRKAELTLGLDLYAPEETEGAELERAVFRLARALVRGGPPDVGVKELAWGETERDGKSRLLRRTVRAVCVVCLTGEEEPSAVFSEFEVRGGLKG